jgi:hypothetical protein
MDRNESMQHRRSTTAIATHQGASKCAEEENSAMA